MIENLFDAESAEFFAYIQSAMDKGIHLLGDKRAVTLLYIYAKTAYQKYEGEEECP